MAGTVIGGTGVVPGASSQIFTELTAMTRRAYIPRLTVQLYFSTPTMMMLMGNAQKAAGGLNQITFPVQGQSMVQGAWAGYSGSFDKPQVIPGVQAAAFNLSYFLVPVPIVMGEMFIQSTEAIIPILDARMNDVYAVTMQQVSSALFTNNTNNSLMPNSFVDGFDNGAIVSSYGGINRSTQANSFWKGNTFSINASFTRQLMARYILQLTDLAGGEAPDFIVMAPGDFSVLNTAFIATNSGNTPVEQFMFAPGKFDGDMDIPIRSSFPNIWVSGVPIYCDHWCPQGTAYAINTKYSSMYLSEDAPFAFSGFYSTIPQMQIGQVGVSILGYNVLTTKPLANGVFQNITGNDF